MSNVYYIVEGSNDINKILNVDTSTKENIRAAIIANLGGKSIADIRYQDVDTCWVTEEQIPVPVQNAEGKILAKLVVKEVATGTKAVVDFFASLIGRPVTPKEELVLYTKFHTFVPLLQDKRLTVAEAKKLLRQIETTVKTETTTAMMNQGYLFDGLLGAVGNGKAMLYHVLNLKTGEVGCAKVYTAQDRQLAHNESSVSARLHKPAKCPWIVCYKDPLEFTHHDQTDLRLLALIMPLYAQSLQSFLDALNGKEFPDLLSVRLGFTLIKIGQVLEEKNICHADIKPSNIMFDTLGNMILIDLGAAVKYGAAIVEHTPHFGMDAPRDVASAIYDLNSIATTLLLCAHPTTHDPQRPWKRNDILNKYKGATHLGSQLACICLESESFVAVTVQVSQWLAMQNKLVKDAVSTLK